MAPSPSDTVGTLLATAELTVRGFVANASNHTLLIQVGVPEDGTHAIYKPRRGERPLWDFPPGTLCQREAAAWVVSDFLGWQVVPRTVLREGPMGLGSVQLFVPHDPEEHYFALVGDERYHDQLARIATFDLLVNNADRKGSHVLRSDVDDRLWGIDHGLTFHPQTKLRTVIWDLPALRLRAAWHADLRRLASALGDAVQPVTTQLEALLSVTELTVLRRRAELLAEIDCLPDPPADRRPYPWPPL